MFDPKILGGQKLGPSVATDPKKHFGAAHPSGCSTSRSLQQHLPQRKRHSASASLGVVVISCTVRGVGR